MRTISAHYAWDPITGFVKNPLLTINNHHEIERFESMGDKYVEYPHVEFFGGLIVPGFIHVIDLTRSDKIDAPAKRINQSLSAGSLFNVLLSSDTQDLSAFANKPNIIIQNNGKLRLLLSDADPWQQICKEISHNKDIATLLFKYLYIPWQLCELLHLGGSFNIGTRPGVLLLNGIDWTTLKFNPNPQLKIIHLPY
jgi:hypothetical protein